MGMTVARGCFGIEVRTLELACTAVYTAHWAMPRKKVAGTSWRRWGLWVDVGPVTALWVDVGAVTTPAFGELDFTGLSLLGFDTASFILPMI